MVDPLNHRGFHATLLKASINTKQMPKGNGAYGSLGGYLFENLSRFFAFLVLCILVAIIVALFIGSYPAIKEFHFGFIVSKAWNPVTQEFGALVPIIGTLITSVIAMLIAVPVSFGIALFLTELSPVWLRRPVGTAIELLAAIPSIIYGMWGLFVFAPIFAETLQSWLKTHLGHAQVIGPLFQGPPMGIGILTAGLILAIMVIPFVASIMRDVFEIVPHTLKESAHALGATTWEVVWHVVLPYTKVGVMAGMMLGLGRALGETMAVTFVIGNAHKLQASLFMPGSSIASTLANEFTEAIGTLYTSSLMYLGLLLFFITFIVLAVSRLFLAQLKRREGSIT